MEHPGAEVIVHPECRPEVIDLADGVFSTDGMIKYAKEAKKDLIIGTESGIIHRLEKENPGKRFYSVIVLHDVPEHEDELAGDGQG